MVVCCEVGWGSVTLQTNKFSLSKLFFPLQFALAGRFCKCERNTQQERIESVIVYSSLRECRNVASSAARCSNMAGLVFLTFQQFLQFSAVVHKLTTVDSRKLVFLFEVVLNYWFLKLIHSGFWARVERWF